jgi:hypothetical protein
MASRCGGGTLTADRQLRAAALLRVEDIVIALAFQVRGHMRARQQGRSDDLLDGRRGAVGVGEGDAIREEEMHFDPVGVAHVAVPQGVI